MDGHDAASGRQADNEVAAPAGRFVVVLGEGGHGSASRIEAPARLLRVRSLLYRIYEQVHRAGLPPEGMPRLQRQLQVIRRELESAVSPPLAEELRRILPPQDEEPDADALRIECTVLVSWADSVAIQMLSTLRAARERLSRPPAAA